MIKRLQPIISVIVLSILLAVPLYFATAWAARTLGIQETTLSMREAYQLALEQAVQWDDSVQLFTMTSVDLDRPQTVDGTTGFLPHWNVDFVASNNELYHVEIRDGQITSHTPQGTASFADSLWPNTDELFMDSPDIVQAAINKGLRPYEGDWARGINFIFTRIDNQPQIIVRGATQSGLPAFYSFNPQDGAISAGAERSVSEGGVYLVRNIAELSIVEREFEKLLPDSYNVPANISALTTVSLSEGQSAIFAGTDTRRDFLFTEQAQLFASYDSGATWESLDIPFGQADAILNITATPDGLSIFVGTTEGLFFAQGINRGKDFVWRKLEQGLPVGYITSLAISPSFVEDREIWVVIGKPDTRNSLWARPGSEGLFHSVDGGRSWEKVGSAPPNITDLALAPNTNTSTTIFVTSGKSNLFKSTDGGQEWVQLPLSDTGFSQLAISPTFAKDGTLFVATGSGVWRSEDGGLNWTLLTSDMSYPTNAAIAIKVSPDFSQDQTVVFSAFRGGLIISRDRGETWHVLDLGKLMGDSTPRAIAFAVNGDIVFAMYPLLGWNYLVAPPEDPGQP